MKINNYFKSIAIVLLILLSLSSLHSQSLKKLGAGLNEPVLSACSDSIGNIYAVSHKNASDSLKIYKFDVNSGTWSLFAAKKDGKYHALPVRIQSSFTIRNNVYVNYMIDSIRFEMYEINQSNWQVKAKTSINFINFNFDYFATMNYTKISNNYGVLYGNFDSLNQVPFSRIVLFDGNNFTSLNYNKVNGLILDCKIKDDTIFIATGNNSKIMFQKIGSGNWSIYTQMGYVWNIGLEVSDSFKYFMKYDSLFRIQNGIINEKMSSNRSAITNGNSLLFDKLLIYNNKLLILRKSYSWDKTLIQKTHNSNLSSIEDVLLLDDNSEKKIFKSQNNKVYIYGNSILSANNLNCDFIVELLVDSLEKLDIDTTVIKHFKDNNENYVFDNGDQLLSKWFFVDNQYYTSNVNGIFNYYHYSNHLPVIIPYNYNNSCEIFPFTGSISPKTNLPNVTRDTLFLPYFASKNFNIEVKNTSFSQARLLDTISLKFKINNKGCINNNGSLNAELKLNPNVQFISSSPNYSSKSTNTLNFSITNLFNSQSREISVKIVYPLNKFSINDVVKHYLKITPSTSDMDSTDNRDSIMQRIVYSYDPNAKFSLPEGKITSDLRKIRYTIHFQNEGNDDARNVTIIDTINLKMPVYSFQMIGATHPYSVSIQPGTNIVTWVFDNINLKPKSENEEKSKGYLVFEANVRGDLRVGDSIRNKAYIYFDYNEPIITNYAVITRVENESGGGTSVEFIESKIKSIMVYPNPTSSVLTVKNLKNETVGYEVFNAMGQSVFKDDISAENSAILNVGNLTKGIYFIKTSTGDQLKFVIH